MKKIPKMSNLEKGVFELVNVATWPCVATGVALLSMGHSFEGVFWLIPPICGEIATMAHQGVMGYERSDMLLWSRMKYSFIPPYKHIGKR